jgi:osmoprotectant transport system ATP-binding protein
MIEFRDISKVYEGKAVVDHLSLNIAEGELFVLVGPSGSGKTTSMKLINRLVEPSDGDTYVRGTRAIDYDLAELRRGVGYVLQNSALFPNMTIFQNAGIQLEVNGVSLADRQTRVFALLDRVGLPHAEYADRMPNELSGGEQQRVGIVRALAGEPDIILMDEPFSALDPISRRSLQDLVLQLHNELKTTILFVTHDMQEAVRLGTRIGVMFDGKLQQVGTPLEITTQPANDLVADFFNVQPLQTVGAMLAAGLGRVDATAKYPELGEEASVADLAGILEHAEGVSVNNHVLTTADLLRFLAQGGVANV